MSQKLKLIESSMNEKFEKLQNLIERNLQATWNTEIFNEQIYWEQIFWNIRKKNEPHQKFLKNSEIFW